MLLFRNRFQNWCLNVDEGGGGGSVPTETTAPQPSEPSVPDSTATPAPQATSWSLREYAKGKGLTALESFKDDQTAFDHLLGTTASQLRQAQQYRQFYEQHAPEFTEYQKWKQQQAEAAKQAAQPAKPKWSPPEYNERWNQMVQRDPETGRLLPVDGAAPDLPQKLANYKAWQVETLQKMLHDPEGTLYPLFEDKVQAAIEARLNAWQESQAPKQAVHEFVQQNADWMYQQDQYGRKVIGNAGLPVWSPAGEVFVRETQALAAQYPGLTHEQIIAEATNRTAQQVEIMELKRQLAERQSQPGTTQPDPRESYAGAPPHAAPTTTVSRAAASATSADVNGIPQAEGTSWRHELRRNAVKAGLIPQGAM